MIKQLLFVVLCAVVTVSVLAVTPANDSVGAKAVQTLKKNLQGALLKALGKGDVAQAIEVCSTQAMALTAQSGKVDPAIVSIERRTDKWRNPANRADSLDMQALQAFRKDRQLVELRLNESTSIMRYYQPLYTHSMCLQCHGDPAGFSADVRAALKERYPDDRATGYTENELRGVIQVRIHQHSEER